MDLDINSPHSVESIVPEVSAAMPTDRDCEKELYCGFPYLMPVTTFLWYGHPTDSMLSGNKCMN